MEEKKLRYLRKYNKKRKEILKSKGICVNCAVRPVSKPHVCCDICLEKKRINSMRKKIDPKYYQSELIKQKGKCSICGKEMVRVIIDHDHKTGKIRGLLCDKCNVALGFWKDDINTLHKAIEYLEKNSI